MQNKTQSLRGYLEQLSTDQLDNMLTTELHSDTMDENAVRLILEILWNREKGIPATYTPEISKAWEKYCETSPQKHPKKGTVHYISRRWISVASAAACILLVLLLIPQSVQADSLFDGLARWTSDILEFFSPEDNSSRLMQYQFQTDHPGLREVYDAVVSIGITDPFVPMWIPDGYTLAECSTKTMPAKKYVYARFKNGSAEISMKFNLHQTDVSHKYMKDDAPITQTEIYGTVFHIMSNHNRKTVVWTKDQIECSISIDCQEETLNKLLGSIYVMEDNT